MYIVLFGLLCLFPLVGCTLATPLAGTGFIPALCGLPAPHPAYYSVCSVCGAWRISFEGAVFLSGPQVSLPAYHPPLAIARGRVHSQWRFAAGTDDVSAHCLLVDYEWGVHTYARCFRVPSSYMHWCATAVAADVPEGLPLIRYFHSAASKCLLLTLSSLLFFMKETPFYSLLFCQIIQYSIRPLRLCGEVVVFGPL